MITTIIIAIVSANIAIMAMYCALTKKSAIENLKRLDNASKKNN